VQIYGPESSVTKITDEFMRWLSENCTAIDACNPDVEKKPDMITAEWLSYGDHVDPRLLEEASRLLPLLQFRVEWGCANYGIEGMIVAMNGRLWCNAKWPEACFDDEDSEN
jgi:hypothetical protein